jgi:16S rRNA (cytidine1402-2'-O)-methyltransferase
MLIYQTITIIDSKNANSCSASIIAPKIKVNQQLKAGENIALVTDAGTPGISDPGMKLVAAAVMENIKIEPIPGASALGAMISVAGIDLQKFIFLAFPPHKKGRETFFKEVLAAEYPVIYFESPHRVIKNLELMQKLGNLPAGGKKVIIGRELTKMFEEIVRGTVTEVLEYFAQHEDKVRGEFVVVVF